MSSPIFDGTAEWYSLVIVGYTLTASLVSIALTALLATGVV